MFQVIPSYVVEWDHVVDDFNNVNSADGERFAKHEHTLRLRVSETDLDAFLKTLRMNRIDRFMVEKEHVPTASELGGEGCRG